jgi:hypothetical protein
MSEQDSFRSRARRCNRKVKAKTGGMIVGMTVYPCDNRCSKPVGINIVKITETNYRDNPELCLKIVVASLLSLPSGFYTVVNHTEPVPCAVDFRLADKGCRLRVRPFDKEAINSIKQQSACLRVVVG